MLATPPQRADLATITTAARLLMDGVAELRCLGTHRGTVSGYYTDVDALVRDAAAWSGKAQGIYITPNPCIPDLLARSANRATEYARTATKDLEIAARRWLLIDLDPVRPAGVSSTDAELQSAITLAGELSAWLHARGFGESILANSGNGAHILYRIDLPNDPEAEALLKGVLAALGARWSNAAVAIDRATYNAARIWKLYGTLACKGDSIPTRPHRLASIIQLPTTGIIVPREVLAAVAADAPAAPTRKPLPPPRQTARANGADRGDYSTLDVVQWFSAHGHYGRPMSGGQHAVLCPWSGEHSDVRGAEESDTCVWEANASGAWPQFYCLHSHCGGRTIEDVIALWGDADRYCSARWQPPAASWPVNGTSASAGAEPIVEGEMLSIIPLRRIGTDPPRYIATYRGRELELTHQQLLNWEMFLSAVAAALMEIPRPPSVEVRGKQLAPQTVWRYYVVAPAMEAMVANGLLEDAPSDAGAGGAAWEMVITFLQSVAPSTRRDDLLAGKVVLYKQSYCFKGVSLTSWLQRNRLTGHAADDLYMAIRRHGGKVIVVRYGRGKGEMVKVWAVPEELVPTPSSRRDGSEEGEGDDE